jgi:hypothetical protein
MGADDAQIGASFCNAVSIAKQQKPISLAKRAEETYAEYQRQKASALLYKDVDSDCLFDNSFPVFLGNWV